MSIELYLQERLDDHCKEHLETEMGIQPGHEDYEEEFEDHKKLLEMAIWRDGDVISVAYYLKVPKKVLCEHGYTEEEIHDEFTSIFAQDKYPY
jgi:hypothetical protein